MNTLTKILTGLAIMSTIPAQTFAESNKTNFPLNIIETKVQGSDGFEAIKNSETDWYSFKIENSKENIDKIKYFHPTISITYPSIKCIDRTLGSGEIIKKENCHSVSILYFGEIPDKDTITKKIPYIAIIRDYNLKPSITGKQKQYLMRKLRKTILLNEGYVFISRK